jgi:soluble cytochrome b562
MREKYEAEVGSAKSAARDAAEEAEALRKEMATRDAELAELRAGMPNAAALMMSAIEAEAMLQAAVRSETETRPAKPPITEVSREGKFPSVLKFFVSKFDR